jgi:hypothetical protein
MLFTCLVGMALLCADSQADPAEFDSRTLDSIRKPSIDYWPRTRWWWMGNALTKEEVEWQLRDMHAHGIGGVEQITMPDVYERGNHPFLSDEHLELLKHGVGVAKELGMEFSLNFGGPGWVWGGDWIPADEQNQCLVASSMDIRGPLSLDGELPMTPVINPRDSRGITAIGSEERLVAVVAGRIEKGSIREDSLNELTEFVVGRTIQWYAPEGDWRVMAFWLTTPAPGVVDHFNAAAMEKYCEHVGGAYKKAVGSEFGETVQTMFADSFEVPTYRNGIYWNQHLLPIFREQMGYDLVKYLPALWFEVGKISPKIRYDVNEFLNDAGFENFFDPFIEWCKKYSVQGRIQAYGFPTDVLEGAGRADMPEMEITAGEKDAVPWFDTRIGPRDYVSSGAHHYLRNIVSVEAYTYLHWEPFRETLEELKIASDVFLCAGANKFYNHGYVGVPEAGLSPTRDFHAAIRIDSRNIWWKYYPKLSEYLARCSYVLQMGRPIADIAVYSPLANQWSKDALNARRWTRDFDWGDLGKLITSNGYDFDLVNDDVLQHYAVFNGADLIVNENAYRVLILPNVETLPIETYERIRAFVKQGGCVIALERVPESSTGFLQHNERDQRTREISKELFGAESRDRNVEFKDVEKGSTCLLTNVIRRTDPLDWHDSALDPFVNALRKQIAPDMGIDFTSEGLCQNDGLMFVHRLDQDRDIYFISNVQDRPIAYELSFRVPGKSPWHIDPYLGTVSPIAVYDTNETTTSLPLKFAPFESTIVVFDSTARPHHVRFTTFDAVDVTTDRTYTAWASTNGLHLVEFDGQTDSRAIRIDAIPSPFEIGGLWRIEFADNSAVARTMRSTKLESWTDNRDTRHYSGSAEYYIDFELPETYFAENIRLELDLGEVWNVAEAAVNSTSVGILWLPGQTLDLSGAVRPGVNTLKVVVTNTLINRVSGLERMPHVPKELHIRLGNGIVDKNHPANALIGWKTLPPSGLLGPVRIVARKSIDLQKIER